MYNREVKMKAYLFINYVNYKGGVNNLQVAKIVLSGERGSYLKCFTSKVDKAEKRAVAWVKKNKINLV